MRSESTQAIVLRRTDYGEADRIIQLCTPLGKRVAIAKGVRRPKSKLAGGIELLSESNVVLRQGRGNMATLTQARMAVFYKNILNSYDRLQFSYEALRHVAKASEMVDEPDWFDILHQILSGLDDESINLALIKAWFYLRYAKLLGDELSLWRDVNGEKMIQGSRYSYDVSEKGFRASGEGEIGEQHIKLLRVLSQRPLATMKNIGGMQPFIATVSHVAMRHSSIY